MQCGILLLKMVIQESFIDTNATTSVIRMALAFLDEYMPTVGDNITKFNQHVSAQVKLLKAREHQTHDLTVICSLKDRATKFLELLLINLFHIILIRKLLLQLDPLLLQT